ncbi:DUF4411 family protein [Candidatus Palauibacter sp.]|uniref:DUF4411 family protein n=1 Tax=Candidatus Palauibacter sp. TaxID=3101350 RepID=UPI003AF2A547
MASRIYLVDSDVFITAKNVYYAFDLCPGFWQSVLHHHRDGRVFSVDRVRTAGSWLTHGSTATPS